MRTIKALFLAGCPQSWHMAAVIAAMTWRQERHVHEIIMLFFRKNPKTCKLVAFSARRPRLIQKCIACPTSTPWVTCRTNIKSNARPEAPTLWYEFGRYFAWISRKKLISFEGTILNSLIKSCSYLATGSGIAAKRISPS